MAHPSSQEVDARVLPDPINIGHTDSSPTGIERGSVPAPLVLRKAPGASLSSEMPSQTGVSGDPREAILQGTRGIAEAKAARAVTTLQMKTMINFSPKEPC